MAHKILVVDDDEINVKIMQKCLSKGGHEVECCYSGEEALEKVPQFNPELIFLDMMMPGMDGIEVCQRLKAEDATKGIVVVFVTAKAMDSERQKGYEAGADDYLTKPFERSQIDDMIKKYLSST